MREGTLEPNDGRWRLQFVRELPHPPEKVWRALTEPEHLAAWFPTSIDGPREAGAALEFAFPKAEAPPFTGTMLTFDPPTTLEVLWGDETLRFDLVADGEGTRLTFRNTFDELGKAARDAAGWHTCLDLFACDLAGEEPSDEVTGRWKQVHPVYVERFGPEAATIGPPEGFTED